MGVRTLQTALICALLALAPEASAMGGGGGAGGGASMPSSRPQIDPQETYREGAAALEARDYRTAITKFRQVLQAAPGNAAVNYALGLALIGNGDARAARRPLERAVAGDNVIPDARLQLGLVYLQQGDRERAQAQSAALQAALTQCAGACAQQAQLQTASDALARALAGNSAAPPANPSSSWLVPGVEEGRAAYASAVGLINAARYSDALVALDRAASAIGPNADILNYMGFAERKLGRFARALDYYEQALALDRDHRGANEYLGELYLEMGRFEDARRQLARLDKLCPYGCAEREELSRWILLASR
jgi:tetratricopeptide (TPR) repeat protein